MIISKDEYLNKWVVWLKKGSIYAERFHAKTKRECEEYVAKYKKRLKNDRLP